MGDDRPTAYAEGDWLVLRASGYGGCIRDLVLHLLGHEPKATPDDLQVRYDAGHRAEPEILKRCVEEHGFRFEEGSAQKEGELVVIQPTGDKPGVKVRYHPDGIALCSPAGSTLYPARIVEAKALAESSFAQAVRKGFGSLFNYDWQLAAMMHAQRLPAVWVAVEKNPDDEDDFSGEMLFEWVDNPPRSKVEIVRRCKEVRDWFLRGEAPDCSDPNQYPCPFFHLRPEKEEKEWAELSDEEAETFAQMASEYQSLTRVVAIGAAADKERKVIKKALDEIAAGRLAVKGNGWRMTTTIAVRPKMVATDEKYETRSIKVEEE